MMTRSGQNKTSTLASCTALAMVLTLSPVWAEQKAHVHGSGALNIAIEGGSVQMELIAPGADIVGFEHDPKTDEDRAQIEKGAAMLKDAATLFTFPSGAGCELAEVDIESGLLGDDHDDHDHDEHAKDDHDHDDHGKDEHAKDDHDHDHDEHAKDEHDHDDHGKDEHAKDDHDHDHDEHAKDEHDHGDHGKDEHAGHDDEDGEQHAEFHATYTFACADATKVTGLETTYFEQFPRAERLQVQAVGDGLQKAMELKAGAKQVDLGS